MIAYGKSSKIVLDNLNAVYQYQCPRRLYV